LINNGFQGSGRSTLPGTAKPLGEDGNPGTLMLYAPKSYPAVKLAQLSTAKIIK